MYRAGLNDLYITVQKNLETEMKLRQQLEQEVDVLKRQGEEKEVAEIKKKRFVLQFNFYCVDGPSAA